MSAVKGLRCCLGLRLVDFEPFDVALRLVDSDVAKDDTKFNSSFFCIRLFAYTASVTHLVCVIGVGYPFSHGSRVKGG